MGTIDEISRVSLDFTHVQYDSGNLFSLVMAICSLMPQGLLVMYATLMFSRREIETFLMFGGQLLAEIITEIIKSYIQQERPDTLGSGYGMPSAHAQFSCFFASYLSHWLIFKATQIPLYNRVLRIIGLVAMAFAISYSRVYLGYHSAIQVLVGMGLGLWFGASWMFIVSGLRSVGFINWLLSWKLFEWFCIKDNALSSASYIHDEHVQWKLKQKNNSVETKKKK